VTPTPHDVPNVLAGRYASADLTRLWSPEHKVVLERRLWIAVLQAQRDLGVDVPEGVIEAYEKVVDNVDLASIRRREAVTRHDVKARIEEFSALAGHEHVHKGMTSRDLTENVEQLQVRSSLELVRDRAVAALARLARLATEHVDLVIAGRSHNVAAQATTLGKRFASAADELLIDILTFGFKFGIPIEADLVFDVRFLTNPYYVPDLKPLSGLQTPVREYVLGQPAAGRFIDLVVELLELTVPAYRSEGKTRLTVALGCTGGYHRSIALAEELARRLEAIGDVSVAVFHRELER